MNILKIKCHRCKDELTPGELDTHFKKPYLNQQKPTCYQCSQEILREVKKRYEDRKNEEFCDYIEDQRRCRL